MTDRPSIALILASQSTPVAASPLTPIQRVRQAEVELKVATGAIVDNTLNTIRATLDRLHEAASCQGVPAATRDAMLSLAREIEGRGASIADLLNKAGLINTPYSPR